MTFLIFSYKVHSFPSKNCIFCSNFSLACTDSRWLHAGLRWAQKVEVLTGDSPEGTRKHDSGRARTKRYIFIIISDGLLRQQWFLMRCRNSIAFHVMPQRLIPAALPHATLISSCSFPSALDYVNVNRIARRVLKRNIEIGKINKRSATCSTLESETFVR